MDMRLESAVRIVIVAVAVAALPQYLNACKCAARLSVCETFAESDAVFAGRVESVEPDIDLLGFSGPSKKWEEVTEEEAKRLEEDDSPATVKRLKEIYSEMIPERFKASFANATTKADLEKISSRVMEEGKRVRLRVQEVFKGPRTTVVDVWTSFSDCAANLVKGETYLVYAWREGQGRLETGACARTRRLTDAGEDLAYLQFVRHAGSSGRISGFITSNEADLKRPRPWRNVPNPVAGLFLELDSDGVRLYAESSRDGEFAFDGLAKGDYTVSVYDSDFPEERNSVAPPRRVTVPEHGCVAAELYVPKPQVP